MLYVSSNEKAEFVYMVDEFKDRYSFRKTPWTSLSKQQTYASTLAKFIIFNVQPILNIKIKQYPKTSP